MKVTSFIQLVLIYSRCTQNNYVQKTQKVATNQDRRTRKTSSHPRVIYLFLVVRAELWRLEETWSLLGVTAMLIGSAMLDSGWLAILAMWLWTMQVDMGIGCQVAFGVLAMLTERVWYCVRHVWKGLRIALPHQD